MEELVELFESWVTLRMVDSLKAPFLSLLMQAVNFSVVTLLGFFMRTSRTSGVYPVHENDQSSAQDERGEITDGTLVIRNHAFDDQARKKAKRKIRFGIISASSAPSRGPLPVRQHHRKDE